MTKELDFKHRFAAVLGDLNEAGRHDPEVIAMIGTLAIDIARPLGATTWTGVKNSLTADGYDELLASFQERGNGLHAQGKTKPAYAIQALATSLVAKTQRTDPDLASGERLLDALIDSAMRHVSQAIPKH